MKQIAIALALSLAWVNSAQAGNNLPEVQIVKTENQRWHFRRIAVYHTDTELAVFGWMNAQLRFGLPHGHVDIAAWSADDKLITETTTDYYPGLLTRHASRKGGVHFSTKLPTLPADARIKVAFHRDEPRQTKNPVHDQTVAR